jgi:hypothetical protein
MLRDQSTSQRALLVAIMAFAFFIAGCCSSPPAEKKVNLILGFMDKGAGNVTIGVNLTYYNETEPFASSVVQLLDNGNANDSWAIRVFDIKLRNFTIAISGPGIAFNTTHVGREGFNGRFFFVKPGQIEETTTPPGYGFGK